MERENPDFNRVSQINVQDLAEEDSLKAVSTNGQAHLVLGLEKKNAEGLLVWVPLQLTHALSGYSLLPCWLVRSLPPGCPALGKVLLHNTIIPHMSLIGFW